MEKDFKHWNGLPREVIRSPCLEVQEMIVCSTLFPCSSWRWWPKADISDLILDVFSDLNYSIILWFLMMVSMSVKWGWWCSPGTARVGACVECLFSGALSLGSNLSLPPIAFLISADGLLMSQWPLVRHLGIVQPGIIWDAPPAVGILSSFVRRQLVFVT